MFLFILLYFTYVIFVGYVLFSLYYLFIINIIIIMNELEAFECFLSLMFYFILDLFQFIAQTRYLTKKVFFKVCLVFYFYGRTQRIKN